MIVFFHQNEVDGAQGGIERYVATLLAASGDDGLLVTEASDRPADARRMALSLPRLPGPKWIPYALAVFARLGAIRRRLAATTAAVLEFSRPEYVVFAWALPGKRVFTIHGTGPGASEGAKRRIHDLACWFLPWVADRVQVVGRDDSGLSPSVRRRLGSRLAHVDAWYDDHFRAKPVPAGGPTVVFYAGRIVEQKNPELLFEIIRRGKARFGEAIEFRYFGKDGDRLVEAGVAPLVTFGGLLDAPGLAAAIAGCHMGLMCSHFGEGSPFIVVETLACGRPYVLSSLPTLTGAYGGNPGVRFVASFDADAFLDAIAALRADLDAGLDAATIADAVAPRAKSLATAALLADYRAL
ncbi:glycosyltransferase [Siculibacillus lacustris]|uniref:Glycosyltransferase n=1 Tax=Siculibacillus lacustris TaxID=1549641 RepID=A0A4Q9VPN5_9HYPH|nr:glycosyltransferase [Siculibacillus lacustris]TBW37589.1 glycosyltransferase [Siculibacillus lacustris]